MRVLHLLNHTNRLNGHVHAAVDLACAQADLGHSVAVASGGGDFDLLLAEHNVQTMLVNHQRRPRVLLRALGALNRVVGQWRPDVIHAHMMTSAVLAWPVSKMRGVPLVTTVHNEFEKSAILMGLGKRVIAVSAAVARSMHQRGIPKNKLDVVLNGTIGAARFRSKDKAPARLDSPSIIFVGGQHPRKGLPDLFVAFDEVYRKYPAARLYIVGDGPHRPQYEEAVRLMGCADAVVFLGPRDDPFPFLESADIFVLPSHADPAPLVLSEAREARCAIIATDVGGIPELLEHGKAGILVPPRSPSQLSAALASLLETPDMLRRWKDNSQNNISYLNIDRVARETLRVYGRAIAPEKSATLNA